MSNRFPTVSQPWSETVADTAPTVSLVNRSIRNGDHGWTDGAAQGAEEGSNRFPGVDAPEVSLDPFQRAQGAPAHAREAGSGEPRVLPYPELCAVCGRLCRTEYGGRVVHPTCREAKPAGASLPDSSALPASLPAPSTLSTRSSRSEPSLHHERGAVHRRDTIMCLPATGAITT